MIKWVFILVSHRFSLNLLLKDNCLIDTDITKFLNDKTSLMTIECIEVLIAGIKFRPHSLNFLHHNLMEIIAVTEIKDMDLIFIILRQTQRA